jgi:hypothetical protein
VYEGFDAGRRLAKADRQADIELGIISQQPRETSNGQLPDRAVEMARIYQEQPATPLPKLAERLAVSLTGASRLRLQAMELQLLDRKTRGYYLPLQAPEQLSLSSGDGDGKA